MSNFLKIIITFISSLIILFISSRYLNSIYSFLEVAFRLPKGSLGPYADATLIALLNLVINKFFQYLCVHIDVDFYNYSGDKVSQINIKCQDDNIKSKPIKVKIRFKLSSVALWLCRKSHAELCLSISPTDFKINSNKTRFRNTKRGLEMNISKHLANTKDATEMENDITISSLFVYLDKGVVEPKIVYGSKWWKVLKVFNSITSDSLRFKVRK